MEAEDFADLLAGLKDVRDYRAGKREGFVGHRPERKFPCDDSSNDRLVRLSI